MNFQSIEEADKEALLALGRKYSFEGIISFLQAHEPQDCLEIKDYSLGRVNRRLQKVSNGCRRLVIKFRGHDAVVLSFFGEENLKRYIQSYGDYDLPK